MCKSTSDEPFVGTALLRELWSTAEEFQHSFRLLVGTIRTMPANRERMGLLAAQQGSQTTAFIALVMQQAGLSYRAAHQVVGQILNQLDERGHSLQDLKAHELERVVKERAGVSVKIP